MTQDAPVIRRPATYQDVLDAPPHMVAEIVKETLHLHPRPAMRHARASSLLGSQITGPFDLGRGGPGGWWIVDEPELHLGANVLVPDIAGWRRSHMPEYPDVAACEVAPDWVGEVLSPGTREHDVTDKRALYAEFGVPHLWFVDPDVCTLEAFKLEAGRWVLTAALHGEEDVAAEPFEAISFPLKTLWS